MIAFSTISDLNFVKYIFREQFWQNGRGMNNIFEVTKNPRLFLATRNNSSAYAYYLLKTALSPALNELTANDVWYKPQLDGWYIFTIEPIQNAEQFSDITSQYLSQPSKKGMRFLWVPYPNSSIISECLTLEIGIYDGKVATSGFSEVLLGNVSLLLNKHTPIFYSDDLGVIQILNKNNNVKIKVAPGIGLLGVSTKTPTSIPIFSGAVGSFVCDLALSRNWLWIFGCDMRYFTQQQPANNELTTQIFPIIDLQESDTSGNPSLKFLMTLSPLDTYSKVTDWVSSLLFLDNSEEPSFPSFFRTITGTTVNLSPQTDKARLRFAPSPKSKKDSADSPNSRVPYDDEVYLTLDGPFKLTFENKEAYGELLCGLFGSEKIRVAAGDILKFEAGHPAFFNSIDENSANAAVSKTLLQSLDGFCTTAWVGVQHISEEQVSIAAAENNAKLGYYAQASASPYFGGSNLALQADAGPATLLVMDAWVSTLSESSVLPVVPMVPFSGIDAVGYSSQSSPNSDVQLEVFVDLENRVLSPVRRALMPCRESGPTFMTTDTPDSESIQGKVISKTAKKAGETRAVTPQGLLAIINNEGKWIELVLSKSNLAAADNEKVSPYLSFADPIDPKLVNSMMTNQLFLVITDSAHIGKFNSLVALDGFTFDLNVNNWKAEPGTILIFKFGKQSIKDLIGNVTAWSQTSDFVGDSEKVELVQQYLCGYINGADEALESHQHPDLLRFCQSVKDENWNGILALNTSVDATKMPREIIGLMGGMDTPLKGHHLQIAVNQINGDGTIDIDDSSLYGLIQYPLITKPASLKQSNDLKASQENTADFNYEVTNLEVAFENATVSNFRTGVKLTIKKLFGREMIIEGRQDSIVELHGSYQTQDNKGIFVFENTNLNCFINPQDLPDNPRRVVERVAISDVVFSTTSATEVEGKPGYQNVNARFSVSGSVGFIADILKIDLFGYGAGDNSNDLAYSALCVDVNFQIDAAGEQVKNTKTMLFNPTYLSFEQAAEDKNKATVRPGSLASGLPFELNSFKFDANGLSTNKMGGKPVHIKFNAEGDLIDNNLITPSPQYALDFLLPLGNLGSMSSVHVALDAHVIVGWGPSPIMKEWDSVGVSVQLPELTPGFKGMSLQGILKTSFGSANLLHMEYKKDGAVHFMYALAFNNVQLTLFGIGLPPGVMLDLFLFADVKSDTGHKGNLGWLLAYSGEKDTQKNIMKNAIADKTSLSGTFEEAIDRFSEKERVESFANVEREA